MSERICRLRSQRGAADRLENRPVGCRVWVTASVWQRKSSEGGRLREISHHPRLWVSRKHNNARQRRRSFFFFPPSQIEMQEKASVLCENMAALQRLSLPAPICGWLVLDHWADCCPSWAARCLTPVLKRELRPARLLRPYLWSWVWCERRSQMCVPSACPGSQTERAAWWPCWGASSPYPAHTCQVAPHSTLLLLRPHVHNLTIIKTSHFLLFVCLFVRFLRQCGNLLLRSKSDHNRLSVHVWAVSFSIKV